MKPSFKMLVGGSEDENPDLEDIVEFLEVLPFWDEDEDFLIVERTDDASRGISASYMQTRPLRYQHYSGIFLLEYRDGMAGRHYSGRIEEGAPLIAAFESYLRDDGAWRELLVWRDISANFDDLRAALPAVESAAAFFPEGEWEKALQEKRQRDADFWRRFDTET